MSRLEDMALFVDVVDAGSFTAAAQRNGLSKSLVSRRIAALEDRLDARLLNRTTRRLTLTDTGANFLERAIRILAEVEEAEALAARLDAEPRGTLHVAAPMSFGWGHLAPALGHFMTSHPGLVVELDLNDRYVDLASERHDMAVRIGKLTDSSLVARRLAPSRRVVVASPDYLARRGRPTVPADLAGHDCLVYSNRTIAEQWRLGDRVTAALNTKVKANNGEALCAAAEAGLGLAVLPTFIAGPPIVRGALEIVMPGIPHEDAAVYAVYLPSRHLSAKVRLLVDYLAAHFGGRACPYWDEGLFPAG
jgi:DNA-binding transcriptional LysR family regulator